MPSPLRFRPPPNNTECSTFLSPGQLVGLVIDSLAALVSAVAVLILFCIILRNEWHNLRARRTRRVDVFKSPLDVYMVSLFISDFLQGLGSVLNFKWIHTRVVQCGAYCTAQGMIQELGETGVAMATSAIAIHTFVIIVFEKGRHALHTATFVVLVILLYLTLFIAIGEGVHGREHYEAPTPYWCWIRSHFIGLQLAGEYFWILFAAVASFLLYIPTFLCIRGNLKIEGKWWKPTWESNPDPSENRDVLTGYPLCYFFLVATLCVVCLSDFAVDRNQDPNNIQEKMPSAATFVAISIYNLSGLVNVGLVSFTRPWLLLIRRPPRDPIIVFPPEHDNMELPRIPPRVPTPQDR